MSVATAFAIGNILLLASFWRRAGERSATELGAAATCTVSGKGAGIRRAATADGANRSAIRVGCDIVQSEEPPRGRCHVMVISVITAIQVQARFFTVYVAFTLPAPVPELN